MLRVSPPLFLHTSHHANSMSDCCLFLVLNFNNHFTKGGKNAPHLYAKHEQYLYLKVSFHLISWNQSKLLSVRGSSTVIWDEESHPRAFIFWLFRGRRSIPSLEALQNFPNLPMSPLSCLSKTSFFKTERKSHWMVCIILRNCLISDPGGFYRWLWPWDIIRTLKVGENSYLLNLIVLQWSYHQNDAWSSCTEELLLTLSWFRPDVFL